MREAGGGGRPKDEDDAFALTAFGYKRAKGTLDVGVGGATLWARDTDGELDAGDDNDEDEGDGISISTGILGRAVENVDDLSICDRPDWGRDGGEKEVGVCERDEGGGGIVNGCLWAGVRMGVCARGAGGGGSPKGCADAADSGDGVTRFVCGSGKKAGD